MYTLNVPTSSSVLYPDGDEEVLKDSLPVGGTDGRPAGRSLAVAGRLRPPAPHAVSSQVLSLLKMNEYVIMIMMFCNDHIWVDSVELICQKRACSSESTQTDANLELRNVTWKIRTRSDVTRNSLFTCLTCVQ